MKGTSILIKPVSSTCNMACHYCFYRDEAEKRQQECYGLMSSRTLKNVIRKTLPRAKGAISYAYQGGEPTLRGLDFFEEAVAWQKQYNKNGIMVTNALQTNGCLIDESWCRFLKKNNFLVGLSIDGIREIHDAFRRDRLGEGTYEKAEHAAGLMDVYGVDYNIVTVVTPMAADSIGKIYEDYRSRGWKYQQYIACLDPLGEVHGKRGYALTPEAYGEFLIRLFRLWYEDVKKRKQPFIRQFENYIALAMGYRAEACSQRGNCGLQNVVEADGSVFPCDFYALDQYRLGNLNEDRMETIEERYRESGFEERSYKVAEECGNCAYYRLCRGDCHRYRDYDPVSGTYKSYFCKSYQMFFDACYEKIVEIGKEAGRWQRVRK